MSGESDWMRQLSEFDEETKVLERGGSDHPLEWPK